jgi:hypothetical protein
MRLLIISSQKNADFFSEEIMRSLIFSEEIMRSQILF